MATNNNHHLFVYGSLRSGFHSPAYEYISRYFDLVSEAKVKGRLYDMGEYPAAVPVNDDTFIVGELYVVKKESEFSWAIGQLDDYEGITTEDGHQPLYKRELADIYVNDKTIAAWIYWYSADVSGRPEIASGDLMEYIHQKNK
ncbi:MAG: gamma-glutamylcyclotransferase family protein [Chitinophagaceae bacterium]